MFGASILLTIAVAAQLCISTPVKSRSAYSMKGSHPVPRHWSKRDRAPPSQVLHLQIGLKQGRFEELEKHLYEVSDPDHSRYGNHLSFDHVNSLIQPTDETLDSVHEWLQSNGIENFVYSPAKDWVNIDISVESAERLLDTKYYVFEHDDGTQISRASEWSIPKHLHEHIDTIQPTTAFMRPKSTRAIFHESLQSPELPSRHTSRSTAVSKACSVKGTTPDCFATLYQTKGYTQNSTKVNQIGFNNFLGDVPIQPDAVSFLKQYAPKSVSGAYKLKRITIDGGPDQTGPLTAEQAENEYCQEANLDFQTIAGMTYPMAVTSYSTGGAPPQTGDSAAGDDPGNEPYLTWVNYVLNQTSPPQIISTSYSDDEQTVPIDYAKRVCNSFAQLGARGVTLLFASGDGGAGALAGNDAEYCVSNDGKNTFKLLPMFPSSCPYVTTVGATQSFEPEVAAYIAEGSLNPAGKEMTYYASGSGFSEYFPRPSYQDAVVPAYVTSMNGLHKGLFNANGRAYPDISAQGLYFQYVWNSTNGLISGTSAATPLLSSVLALVNDALIASGNSTLGFLNPWLYKKGYQGFTDVLTGSNGGCNTTGFPVTKGWDAVTGFGTPIFPKIVGLAKKG